MANPWMDDEKARRWTPTGKPGQAEREAALDVVARLLDVHTPRRILDLGCGIGDVDARLLARFPEAALTAIDAAPGMLARAREALAPFGARATILRSELEGPWHASVAPGFDAVLASQVVHHLEASAKRDLFARVAGVMAPGGLFVLHDKVRFEAALYPHHVALWNASRARHGFPPAEPEASYEAYRALEAEGGDVPDRLLDQLLWLEDAGFAPVDVFWCHGDKVVFGGLRPQAAP